jgi:hypothetical protein
MGFFDGGAFLNAAPARPVIGKDLGEYGSSGRSGSGYALGSGGQALPSDAVIGNYWARSNGVVFPSTIGDMVAIGQYESSYGAKLSVNGGVFALGYLLSDQVFITKDYFNNLVFTDPVTGSKTLAELASSGAGDVVVSGSPTNLQLAQWINGTHIQGINISSLTLTQSQVTGLVTALAGKASKTHNLVDTVNHPVTGLTPGYVLTALTPTSYAFQPIPGPGGTINAFGTPVAKQVAVFASANTIEGDVGFTYDKATGVLGVDTIKALGVSGNLTLSLKAADSSSDAGGDVFLIPGEGPHASGNVYIGSPVSTSSFYYLGMLGTATDIGFWFITKGAGPLAFGSETGYGDIYLAASASKVRIGTTRIQIEHPNRYTGSVNVVIAPEDNFTSDNVTGVGVILRGSNVSQGGTPAAGNNNGGNIYIYGGFGSGTGTTGKIFLGTGSAGTNPLPEAGIDDTYMLTYNPTTGQISCLLIL